MREYSILIFFRMNQNIFSDAPSTRLTYHGNRQLSFWVFWYEERISHLLPSSFLEGNIRTRLISWSYTSGKSYYFEETQQYIRSHLKIATAPITMPEMEMLYIQMIRTYRMIAALPSPPLISSWWRWEKITKDKRMSYAIKDTTGDRNNLT